MPKISLIFSDEKIVDQALDGSDIAISDSVDIVDVSSLDLQGIVIVNDVPGDKGSLEITLADGSVHTLAYNLRAWQCHQYDARYCCTSLLSLFLLNL